MAMRGGKLRHSITIQQVTENRTGTGSIEPAWSTFVTVRSAIKWLSGGESNGDQVNAVNRAEFKIRYVSGITQKMRVLYGSRVFDIQGALNIDERNREIIITAIEHV